MTSRAGGEVSGVRAAVVLGLAVLLAGAAVAEARSWAWLGVRIRDLSEQEMDEISTRHGLREGFGVVIVEALAEAPASRAGIRAGDIVVAFEGRPVTDARVLQRLVAAASVGGEVEVTVLRPAGRQPLRVHLGTMPRDVAGERVAAEFGFALRTVDRRETTGIAAEPARSPAVAVVARGSAAERAGLEVGDVILEIGERQVLTRDEARDLLGSAPLDRPLHLAIRRGDQRLRLALPTP